MEIRQLNPTDAEEYLSIRLEALKDSPYAFASSYEEEKNQTAEKYKNRFNAPTNTFTFGAFEDSQLVGVVTLVKEQLYKLRHRANIVAMYIKPEKRGNGIGKALVSSVIEKVKNIDGIEQIYLTVVTTNVPAKKLYSSCGFEVFGKEKRALKFDNTYYDEEHMVLFLF
ncbi:GNAT family N-acetyltransferase [Aquibacillus sp. 3ASR75-11]|uniref:GNAT family N-acetyltransferase n=1 Tax=Terrihalobacillus insolitus TaxID=2950438 RepID=A0A9X3WT88_9BACI|nr:GNAT family N-acetyltransferase [Terrihalobacillus insolitus]MDC3411885.1 GNAT family N-acetyltransferase [Terrihalobacillus insolitus]MDC3423436.1 GNAT family N-acetyltransferase [Terrihalobacillus insolitus]